VIDMSRKREKHRNSDVLQQALEDWRAVEVPEAKLPSTVRERVMDAIRGGGETRVTYQTPLFLPLRRVLLATAVPVLVLALAVGYLLIPGGGAVIEPGAQVTNLDVIRQGDDVIFVIANGDSTHRVYKSNDLSTLGAAEPVEVSNGVFRDRIDPDNGLVFYRID
jgi:hypothetical protein